jgi:hypothetical protein
LGGDMKKIRVTVPEDIWRMMRNDVEELGINNNKLCNYILDKLKYQKDINVEKLLETQGRPLKKIIQFDLNVANKEIYYDVLKENSVDIEAEFFRELFEIYTSKFKYQRELFVFEERVKKILEAIKNKRKLKIKYMNKIYTVEPFFIKREEQGDENFLFCFCEDAKGYINYKLKELEIISVLDDKIKGKDKKYIENVRKNFDPFLGNGNFVKVKLTNEGVSLTKSLTNYRPKLVKKSGDIYTFEASNENIKLYFRQFLKEAVILEPKELREEMKKEFLEAFESYNS